MTKITSKLEQLVKRTVERAPIIPVKTDEGILVGNVLIESQGSLKNLWQYQQLVYDNVNLNTTAIKLANNLVKYGRSINNDMIYDLDQHYGRYLIDSQLLYRQYKKLIEKQDFERADIFWARYIESKTRCQEFKNKVTRLCHL